MGMVTSAEGWLSSTTVNVAVVPVTIRGTRSLLRAGSGFPHHGTVRVNIAGPILPEGADWPAAMKLREAARSALLVHLGEPDLTQATSDL